MKHSVPFRSVLFRVLVITLVFNCQTQKEPLQVQKFRMKGLLPHSLQAPAGKQLSYRTRKQPLYKTAESSDGCSKNAYLYTGYGLWLANNKPKPVGALTLAFAQQLRSLFQYTYQCTDSTSVWLLLMANNKPKLIRDPYLQLQFRVSLGHHLLANVYVPTGCAIACHCASWLINRMASECMHNMHVYQRMLLSFLMETFLQLVCQFTD